MGGRTGSDEDNFFFSQILKNNYQKSSGQSIIEAIEVCLTELEKKGYKADAIFLSKEYNYVDKSLSNDSRFVSRMNMLLEGHLGNNYFLGRFDNINLFTSHSPLLKSTIVVCSFRDAFKMRYKTNPDWYEELLDVTVTKISDEEALQKLEENPAKWKKIDDITNLSNEDASILIKTSIEINIWLTVDFQIVNKDAYVVGYIDQKDEV